MARFHTTAAILSMLILAVAGCAPQPEGEVVVYSALDQEFAAPILSSFTRSAGAKIKPRAQFGPSGTVDLADQIIAQRDEVAGDLFWDDAVLDTVRLQKLGLLAPHDWDVPSDWPAVAEDQTWCGFAARARVLIINENQLPDPAQRPTSVLDLADARWQGQCGIARPLSGTTATHAAVLYQQLGGEKFREFFSRVATNAQSLPSNRQVAHAVAVGQLAWGLTDSDAGIVERDDSMPVVLVFPDQQPSQFGTLRIPNTIAVLKNAPHKVAAHMLADFLVSPATEERLAMGDSAQIPLFRAATYQPRVLPPEGARWMDVDFEAAADGWDEAAEMLKPIFPQP